MREKNRVRKVESRTTESETKKRAERAKKRAAVDRENVARPGKKGEPARVDGS